MRSENPPSPSRRSSARVTRLGWLSLALVVVAIIAVVLLLAGQSEQSTVVAANVRDIQKQPDAYLGERVVVSGRVDEVLTHRALTLGSDLASDPLLVLVEESALINGYELGGALPMAHGQLYQEQDVVQFVGTLETFERESLAEQLDIVLNEELFDEMEGDPVLLVERLDVAMFGGFFPSPVPVEDATPMSTETPSE